MGPIEQLRRHFDGRADQFRDHGDRNRRRVRGNQIGFPLRRESVDQLMRERLDPRRQPFDLTRNEGAIDQAAQPGVLGRFQLQAANAVRSR